MKELSLINRKQGRWEHARIKAKEKSNPEQPRGQFGKTNLTGHAVTCTHHTSVSCSAAGPGQLGCAPPAPYLDRPA